MNEELVNMDLPLYIADKLENTVSNKDEHRPNLTGNKNESRFPLSKNSWQSHQNIVTKFKS